MTTGKRTLNANVAMYRIHENDTIRFDERLKFVFVNPWSPDRLKPFCFSSAAFFYLDNPEGEGWSFRQRRNSCAGIASATPITRAFRDQCLNRTVLTSCQPASCRCFFRRAAEWPLRRRLASDLPAPGQVPTGNRATVPLHPLLHNTV